MQVFYVEKIDPSMQSIISKCHPGYNGKKVKLSTTPPTNIRSYWNDGSRSYYTFFSLDTGEAMVVESNHPVFEAGKPYYMEKLPERVLLVEHSIFQGKDMGITIYANSTDMAPMLPSTDVEMTIDERIVLTFTKCYKSQFRLQEANRVHHITMDRWNTAKEALISKGLLNKAGAITTNGKNAIQGNEVEKY